MVESWYQMVVVMNDFISKETTVLCRWETKTRKFGSKRVDKVANLTFRAPSNMSERMTKGLLSKRQL